MRILLHHVPRWLGSMTLLWFCLMGGPVVAQPDDGSGSPDAVQDGEQETPEPQGEVPVTDQPGGIQAANESVEDQNGDAASEEDDDAGPGRFIPSEQISQDLGVSFPADI